MKTDSQQTTTLHNVVGAGCLIREALARINNLPGGAMTLFVTDDGGRLAGTLTDGDIRRGLLAGRTLDDAVAAVMKRDCLAIREGDDPMTAIRTARRRLINMLPCTDAEGRLTKVIDLDKTRALLPLDAVMMAGGRGERLKPLTDSCPKPLLPVGGKPIIDYNVEALESYGIENIFVTVNYLKEQIEEHFREREARGGGATVRCVAEPKRLGTFGSMALVDGLKNDNVLVMNSDLLTTISFEKMLERHLSTGADITMGCIPYNVSVPFAILRIDDDRVEGMSEKPTYNYLANAGVYIVRRGLLSRIKAGEYLDAPDFIQGVIDGGGKVVHYPIDGLWIDIGSPDDYRNADNLMVKTKK